MIRRLFTSFPVLLALLGAIGFAGCDDDPATGRVHLVLGDAPYPVDMIESAEVSVEAIRVHISEGGNGWETLPFTPKTFDLLDLQNGVTAELVDAEVPVGNLDEVRLVISSGQIVLTDGRTMALTVPSGASSGLKIKVRPPITIQGDLTSDVLLDMDVSRSFRPIPSSPQQAADIDSFHFNPVVRAANLSTTGSASGYVFSDLGTPGTEDDEPLEGASILVHAGTDSSTALTDTTGYFRVLGLDPGIWQIEAEALGYSSAATSVEVFVGNDARADTLRLTPDAPRAR